MSGPLDTIGGTGGVKYEATDGHMIFLQAQFTLAAGNYTQRISFYPWDAPSGSSAIPVIAFKS